MPFCLDIQLRPNFSFHPILWHALIIPVSKLGYYIPWSALSGILSSVGLGLVSPYTPQTSTAVWINYQIVVGAGRGCGIQMASFVPRTSPCCPFTILLRHLNHTAYCSYPKLPPSRKDRNRPIPRNLRPNSRRRTFPDFCRDSLQEWPR